MGKKGLRASLLIILILLIIAIIAIYNFQPKPKLPPAVKINTKNQPTMGNPNAKVHIVAFEDLKCFNCKRFNNLFFDKIKKRYIDTGKAKYTMINLAFIPGSVPAANAARCLYAQNKNFFFPFVKYVYKNQPPEDQNWATIPTLMQFANHIKGVNKKKLAQCMITNRYVDIINNNFKIAQKIMNPIATPSIYINGRIVEPLNMQRIDTLVSAAKADKKNDQKTKSQ